MIKSTLLFTLTFFLVFSVASAQDIVRKKSRDNSTGGSSPSSQAEQAKEAPSLTLDGYIDAYMRLTSDSSALKPGDFEKFETFGQRPNQVGLNVARLSAAYSSELIRGNLSLHYGDIQNSWDRDFPMLQEANVGVRLGEGLWLDAGYFSTHVGTEVLYPRDNLMSSLALGTFHEPFYMSAATLTYDPSDLVSFKLVVANDYYTLNRNDGQNSDLAYGFAVAITPTDEITISYTNLIDNQADSGADTSQWRFYNNLYFAYTTDRLMFQIGGDFSSDENSAITEAGVLQNETATAFNFLASVKYYFVPKAAAFVRLDHFNDPDGILSSQILTNDNKISGLIGSSITLGGEYKPTEKSYVRLEGRYMTADSDQLWFTDMDGKGTNERFNLMFTLGFSFTTKNLMD